MDGNNFGNNDQNNTGSGNYQNTGGTNNQYGGYQNNQDGNGQYGNYQNSQNGNGQYGNYQNSQNGNGQYGNYQNGQNGNGQYGNYQNGQNGNGQYGNYQNNPQYGYQDNTAQMPPYPAPIVNPSAGNRANGLQVAGLVCGILAICACWCYGVVSIVLGIAGLICSVTGNNRSKHGVGIAGIVCSTIGLVLGIASLIYYIWAFQYLNEIGYFDAIMKEFYR